MLRARTLYNELLQRHAPTTDYKQPVSLIVSADYYASTPKMGVDGWASGVLDVHLVAGDLDSYLGIHVETTAEQVRDWLQATNEQMRPMNGAAR